MAVYLCSCGPSESLEQISVQSQPSYPGGSTWYFKQGKVAQHRDKSSSHHYLALRNIISDRHYDAETTNNMFCSASSAGVKMVTFTGPVIYLWLFGRSSHFPISTLFFILSLFPQGRREGWTEGRRTETKIMCLGRGQSAHFVIMYLLWKSACLTRHGAGNRSNLKVFLLPSNTRKMILYFKVFFKQ